MTYGQDAPGVRLGMIVTAVLGAALVAGSRSAQTHWPDVRVLPIGSWLGALVLLYGAGMSSYMTWSSRVGKLKTRDALLDRAGRLRAWRGDEVVVDVGCGRGLMLIGAAKRLDRGTAIGIDLWRSQDLPGNSRDAALANARHEGVAGRVRIESGDARSLPQADESVDVVLSHWLLHNLDLGVDREKALDEMWRVLRPGGVLVLADIGFVPRHRDYLLSLGAAGCDFFDGGYEALIMGFLSGGSYKPQALVCSKSPVEQCR